MHVLGFGEDIAVGYSDLHIILHSLVPGGISLRTLNSHGSLLSRPSQSMTHQVVPEGPWYISSPHNEVSN